MKNHTKQLNNVESIVREHLLYNKCTGLYNELDSCCCDLGDDFMDCPYAVLTGPCNCVPGTRRKIKLDENKEGYIVTKKRTRKKA